MFLGHVLSQHSSLLGREEPLEESVQPFLTPHREQQDWGPEPKPPVGGQGDTGSSRGCCKGVCQGDGPGRVTQRTLTYFWSNPVCSSCPDHEKQPGVPLERTHLCTGMWVLLTRPCTLMVMNVSPQRNPTTEDGQYHSRAVISLF